MADLCLKLLGPIQVEREGEPVRGFRSQKALALLGYLAVEARPVSRHFLAGLFWGDAPDAQARGELRRVLHNLSARLPGCLKTDRKTVQFEAEGLCRVDVAAFTALQGADVSDLASAADLYRGEPMEGLYLDGCPEFETWLLTERERRRRQISQVLQTLITHHADRSEYEAGLRFCARLLALEPWQETAQRQMMTLLARSDQRSAALAQYETCRRILAEALGVEPAEETKRLYERIKGTLGPRPHNLPSQPTPFVGRTEALGQLKGLLAKPECRLLTLLGPGGIGKTRLAIQAARALANEKSGLFIHGVYFVSLAAGQSTGFLIPALADALGFSFAAATDRQGQLLDYLRSREMLLILDGFETLLTEQPSRSVNLVTDILGAAAQVKLLITSRQALNLREAWLYPLKGMSFPPPQQARPAKVEQAASSYDAVQLFEACAKRVRPDFSPTVEKGAVVRICQLAAGMPLAIELAAGWLKLLSCAEVVWEIEGSLDILATSHRNMPERHRSLRAVFESSWKRLSREEQSLLARLSVFRGGFSREAAAQVALTGETRANFMRLGELVDKSLLHLSEPPSSSKVARYSMHALLQQFAAEKLQRLPPGAEQETGRRHSRYYAAFVQAQEPRLRGAKRQEALAAINQEIDNVQAGWQWAVSQKAWPEIERYLEGLYLFYELQGWFQEGEATFARAAQHLGGEHKTENRAAVAGRLLARQGWFCRRLGRYDQARLLAEESLTIARETEAHREIAFALHLLGLVAYGRGDYARAKKHYQESLLLWRKQKDSWGRAIALFNLGLVYQAMGEYRQAGQPYREGLAIFKEAGYQFGATTAFGSLGRVARNLGDYTKARQLCQESLVIHREMENPWGVAAALDGLGAIDWGLGKYDRAKESFQLSLAVRRQLDDPRGVAMALHNLGQLAYLKGAYEEARRFCSQSLAIQRDLGDRQGAAMNLHALCQIAYFSAEYQAAEQFCRESLGVYTAVGNRAGVATSLCSLGYVSGALGDDAEAGSYFERAFETAVSAQAAPVALDVLLGRATLLAGGGDTATARALLALVLRHPAGNQALEEKAKRLLPDLIATVSDAIINAGRLDGSVDELAELVQRILGE